MAERVVKLSEEELKEKIFKKMVECYGNIDVKEIKLKVGTAFYDDDPKVSCEIKVEIPGLTLPL